MTKKALWNRFKQYYYSDCSLGLAVDISRMNFSSKYFEKMKAPANKAFEAMDDLEAGAIANPDEKRMVGHYWLRDSSKAPNREIKNAITTCLRKIKKFATEVHSGAITGEKGKKFKNLLVVGIGGSALGPQFVTKALGTKKDKMAVFFFDNTDPDGMDNTLQQIGRLDLTLTVVISKSGGTKETRNGMVEAQRAYELAGLNFGKHAVAITQQGSLLDQYASKNKFLARFPMWDWVGGRTSELSAVGLLPAALEGLDIQAVLDGAKAMDKATRVHDVMQNPAMLLALMWYHAGKGKGLKDMVILPYKDRLELFSKYLQQLVMESLGKEKDMAGKTVYQGIAVYGNKGSTDQHAYVQQLREGVNNFFATFIEVLTDRAGTSMEVDPGATSGDYLSGFHQGTRMALHENDRESITITVDNAGPETVGKLIALYERAVGFYATLVNINAYHQPGVEAGKKAAAVVLEVQASIMSFLHSNPGQGFTADQIATAIGAPDDAETAFKILQHLSANPNHGVKREVAECPFAAKYSA